MDLIDRRMVRTEGSKSSIKVNGVIGLLMSCEATGALNLRLWEDQQIIHPPASTRLPSEKKRVNKTNESRKRGSDTSAQGNEQE